MSWIKIPPNFAPEEAMMLIFVGLDINEDGKVTVEELRETARRERISDREVTKFLQRFDANRDGVITFDEYVRGLNLNREEAIKERRIRINERDAPPKFDVDGVEIVHSTMTVTRQKEVVAKFQELLHKYGDRDEQMNLILNEMKTYLDSQYLKTWQCLILNGSYWMKFNHEPFGSIQFQMGKNRVFVAWRINRA
ncbi:unnamed protein product [Calicophoron daubneyi]|uniref:EF-hand domain-containing protein n=1 Tax=Calicophoron daubneyi TaxID=300641 RepID=A0AAV2TDP8_CALDB